MASPTRLLDASKRLTVTFTLRTAVAFAFVTSAIQMPAPVVRRLCFEPFTTSVGFASVRDVAVGAPVLVGIAVGVPWVVRRAVDVVATVVALERTQDTTPMPPPIRARKKKTPRPIKTFTPVLVPSLGSSLADGIPGPNAGPG